MRISSRRTVYAVLLGLVLAVATAAPSWAAEPYESDPTLSLIGSCITLPGIDPVPDPSCPYPPPPGGPTGRFVEPRAIAVDQYGNEYVASFEGGDKAKGRVDVFDDEGRFITEFAASESRTAAIDTEGNLYIFRDFGDVVRYEPSEYKPEEGNIKYEKAPVLVASAAIGSAFSGTVAVDTDPAHLDQVLISRPETVIRYKSAADAEPNGVIESYKPPGLGFWPEVMTLDSQRRRLFVSYCKEANVECGVKILDADDPEKELAPPLDGSNTPAKKFAAFSGRLPLAVDEGSGDLLVADPSPKKIYQFGEEYEYLSQVENVNELEIGGQIAISNGTRDLGAEACKYPDSPPPPAGDACNRHYLFVAMFNKAGRVAAFHPPGQVPPVIESVATPGIGRTEAELAATIFPGGVETEYHFEITTQAAWEANEFAGATVIPGGTIPAESLATEVSSFATGLTPGETYRFRAVAENSKGKGKEEGQNEATFATYDDASISLPGGCPNEALRVKASALLPDCRAYELVTPADTSGRPPKGTGFLGSTFSTLQASPGGDAVSFKIDGGSLPDSSGVGSFEGDPYVSRRGATGWETQLAGATGAEATISAPASVSPDQGYAFWRARGEGPLVVGGLFFTEYLHYPDGHSELIGRGSEGSEPVAKGKLITENAAHVIFQTINIAPNKAFKLEPDAPPTGTEAVYDRTIGPAGEEQTHTVSLLPGDVTPPAGENALYQGASKDGEGIAFSLSTKPSGAEGKLYLRLHNETSYAIGKGEAEFAGLSEGGERIFYVEAGDLKAFDTSSEEVIDFAATGDAIPVNIAEGGSRAYFISPSVLPSPGSPAENSQGDTPIPPASGQGTLGAKGTGTLSAAKGEGTLEAESKKVTALTTSEGSFEAGMQITGTGIPAGTTIKAVGAGTLTLSQDATQSGAVALTAGSTKVSALTTSQGSFEAGMQITGTGIPAGTTIKAVTASSLTLSKAATKPGVAVPLTAGSTKVTGVSTGSGEFQVGMNVTAIGIPTGTVITAIDEGAQTLTLSKEAAASSGSQPLSAYAQNLYLSEEGQVSFLATVTGRDSEGEPEPLGTAYFDGLGLWTEEVGDQPARDPSRTNPSGSVLLFQSRANITGYPASAFPQIYRYDATAGDLRCISCIPTGAPATGGASLETYGFDSFAPQPFSPSGYVPNQNPAGTRVFFDSTEALVSSDTDKVTDVYEWEADGVGSCTRPAGCVYLISSGQSERANYLYAHSTSGDDVFFTTGDSLTGSDVGGVISIYDAKVGGGFPEPTGADECVGDGCRPQVSPAPVLPTPAPPARGADDQVPAKPKTCPKGKHKVKQNGKVRCVKKHKKHKGKGNKAKKRAGANGRVGK